MIGDCRLIHFAYFHIFFYFLLSIFDPHYQCLHYSAIPIFLPPSSPCLSQDIRSRKPASLLTPCHVINLETPDNHEEAHKASQVTIRLVAAIHDVVNNSSKSSSSSSTSTSSSAMSDNRNSLREGKHDSSEGGLDDETLALESMLTTMSAHLPYPDSAAHRAPMYRWSEAMPGLLAQFEEELEKPIDHIVLWV